MKNAFSFIKDSRFPMMVASVVAGVLFVTMAANASTTISTNIQTDGTLSVTGASTLTGLASMIQASSTRFSVHDTAYFGGTATSTFSSAGALTLKGDLTLQNDETISNSTNGTIALTATNVTFSGLASSTTFKVGNDLVSTVSGMIFGTCTGSFTVTASSSAYVDCTGATGVTSSYKVFVQATSSMPTRLDIVAASSTATAGTINLLVSNDGITGGNVSSSVNTLNFWAVR